MRESDLNRKPQPRRAAGFAMDILRRRAVTDTLHQGGYVCELGPLPAQLTLVQDPVPKAVNNHACIAPLDIVGLQAAAVV